MKFPSFSRLFGADWRARASRRKGRRPQQAGRAKPPTTRLTLEGLEDRTLMAVLPTPVINSAQFNLVVNPASEDASSVHSTNPMVVMDPVNPQKLVAVYQKTRNSGAPSFDQVPPTLDVEYAFSTNGGSTWTQSNNTASTNLPGELEDPNLPEFDTGGNRIQLNLRQFTQETNATAAFDRSENFYLAYLEHNDANTSGALVLQKYNFSGATPTKVVTDNVLARWLNRDPILNPVVAIDANTPTFTDTAPDGTTRTQTDTMVGKAVYVAFNTNNSAPTIGRTVNFNPNTIKVLASADGGLTFTTQVYVNDGAGDPNFYSAPPPGQTVGTQFDASPKIVFTQGSTDGRVSGGQLTFLWNNFANNTLVVDASHPDNSSLSQAAASAAVFTQNLGQNTGTLNNAIHNPNGTPDFPQDTQFSQTLNFSNVDPNFQSLADLDVSLGLVDPHLNQLRLVLSAVDKNGNPLGSVTLFNNQTNAFNQNFGGTIGLADNNGFQLNLGGTIRNPNYESSTAPLGTLPDFFSGATGMTVFDQQAPVSINDRSVAAPYIGHLRPEGGGLNTGGLNAFKGLTRAQLDGSTWTLTFTDNYDETGGSAPTPPLIQFLDKWSLNFSANISTTGFGTDNLVKAPQGEPVIPNTVAGAAASPYPLTSPSSTRGIGPGAVIASDNTLGAYSPFQGRLYIAYVTPGPTFARPANPNGTYTDNTNIALVRSDDGGATWHLLTNQVNDDRQGQGFLVGSANGSMTGSTDGFSEGSRPQFMPALAVDQATGTVVLTFYDARFDAARARVTTYIADSIDGGSTFGPETFLNASRTAIDAYVAAKSGVGAATVTLEPLPNNMAASQNIYGFGDQMGLAVFAGHVVPVWAGNLNDSTGTSVLPNSDIFSSIVTLAAGPRIVAGDEGPVTKTLTAGTVSYNNTFASDGTRQLTGFVVTFDRPVDVSTFTADQVQVSYHDTSSPLSSGNVLMTVSAITPLDATTLYGPAQVGGLDLNGKPTLATQFLITILDPATGKAPSRVGTYSYLVGPTPASVLAGHAVRDRIRTGRNTVDTSGPQVNQASTDTPQPIAAGGTARSTINVSGVPSPNVIQNVRVTLNVTYPFVQDLRVTLFAPGMTTGIPLVLENTVFNANYTGTIFDDNATTPIRGQGTPGHVGVFRPESPLSILDGNVPNGAWRLVINNIGNSTGSLVSWALSIQTGVATGATGPGNAMDQNQNGVTNEPFTASSVGDDFVIPTPLNGPPFQLPYDQNTLPLIIPGPHVVDTFVNNQPAGQPATPRTPDNLVLNGTNSSIDVVFDRAMNAATFAGSSVLRMIGPAGVINGPFTVTADPNPGVARLINGVTTTAADPAGQNWTFKVSFPQQQLSGTYTLVFAPTATDTNGNAVDTNTNAGLDVLRGQSPAVGQLVNNVYDSNNSRYKGNTPVAITPGKRAVATITIPDTFAIQQATLQLTIQDNSNVSGDALDPHLTATLVGPDGTTVRLFTQVGDFRKPNGFTNTVFSDTASTPIQNGVPPFSNGPYNPQTPLSALVGKASSGVWTLFIDDTGSNGAVTGTLTDWSLTLVQSKPVSGLGESVADQFTASYRIFTQLPTNLLSHTEWTAVGPASENAPGEGLNGANAGQVSSVAIDPSDPSGNTAFAAGASGGVWKTTNFLTTNPTGPTWVPLTDFGPTFSLNIGSIALFPRNGDPRQTIVFAATGDGSTGSYGVGILRSLDGGATWTLLDSTSNANSTLVGDQSLTPVNSGLRDHMFVGTSSFKLTVDPHLSATGVILYLAVTDPNNPGSGKAGVWVSRDSGQHWGNIDPTTQRTLGTPNLPGDATDVALSNTDVGADGQLQTAFAGIRGVGVFLTRNEGITWTQTADGSPAHPFQGNTLIRNGDVTPPSEIPVNAPADTPNGAKGRIVLVTAAATTNALQNFFLQGWVYAVVVTPGGQLDGLYESKDFGGNWTKVNLPQFQFGFKLNQFGLRDAPPVNSTGLPTNNEQSGATADPTSAVPRDLGASKFPQGNYDVSLSINPNNPAIVYIGGTDAGKFDPQGQLQPQGGLIRVDTTTVFDPKALIAGADFRNAPGQTDLTTDATTGGIVIQPPPFGHPYGLYEPNPFTGLLAPPQSDTPIFNLERDPFHPFTAGSGPGLSTILVSQVVNFTNTGLNAYWTPFNVGLLPSGDATVTGVDPNGNTAGFASNVHQIITIPDPITGHARLVMATDNGVFTAVDYNAGLQDGTFTALHLGNGLALQSLGGTTDLTQPGGDVAVVTGSRNGNLQIAQFNYGASQPSIIAAQISGVLGLFYGNGPANGSPHSDPNILSNGNLNWSGPTGSGTGVATDQTGGGSSYFFYWPSGDVGEGPVPLTGNFTATDFFQVNIPGQGQVSRTGGNASNLVKPGDNPAFNQGEWAFNNLILPGTGTAFNSAPFQVLNSGGQVVGTYVQGNFAVNSVDPNGIVISGGTSTLFGNLFLSTDQGKNWRVIGQGVGADGTSDLDGSYAPAVAFGAPDPNAVPGALDNLIYAGTTIGQVFVTFTGGGFNGSTHWKNITGGTLGTAGALDGSPVRQIVADPRRGSHDLFAVTQRGVYYMADSSVPSPTWQNITGNLKFANPNFPDTGLAYIDTLAVDWRYHIPDQAKNPTGPVHPVLYVGGMGGVYRSTDKGVTWTVFPSLTDGSNTQGGMLPNVLVTSLTIATGNVNPTNGVTFQPGGPDILLAATYGRGEFAIRLPVNGLLGPNGQPIQDANLTSGQGPRVINDVPSGAAGTVSAVTITFNGPIDPLSIQTATASVSGVNPNTVATLLGPGNTKVNITSIVDVTPAPAAGQPNLHNVYQINFAPQTTPGVYVLTVGPHVTDLAGESMDQNMNGAPNEPGVDTFTANFFLNTRAPGDNPALHATPTVPGIVARVATSSDPSTPVNSLEVLVPSPTTSQPNASPPRATGFAAANWGQLPALPAGDTYVDGVSGDFDGDGKTDYAAMDLATGDWFVALNNGSGFSVSKWGSWGANIAGRNWVDVKAGYFFGRNKPEGIAGRLVLHNGDGSVAAENWFIAQSDGTKFTSAYAGSWYPENGFTWSDVLVGDFNGDGFDDISGRINYPISTANNAEVVSVNDQHGGWVGKNATTLAASFQVVGQWAIGGQVQFSVVDVRAGDFTGDGKTDLVARFKDYGYVVVGVSNVAANGMISMNLDAAGPGYWQTWNPGLNWTDTLVADFDGNGTADLVTRWKDTGAVYVTKNFVPGFNYHSAPAAQELWQIWNNQITWADTTAVDLDGDGRADLISRFLEGGHWFVSYADPSGTQFQKQVYAGGAGPALPASWSTNATYVDARTLYQL